MKLSLAEVIEGSRHFVAKVVVPQGEVVYRFILRPGSLGEAESGWTMQELRGRGRLDPEGKKLSHCVGSYCQKVKSGKSVIYSLRDPDGVPYVTMEWSPEDEQFEQVFGHGNSSIGAPEFNDYVLMEGQFNEPPLKKEDVPEVVEAIRAMVVEFIDEVKSGDVRGLLLAKASLTGRDLSGADLRAADLRDANLRAANLRGASLRGASLRGADLRGASLSGADLRGAHLLDAGLLDADLTNANLTNADLRNTDLRGASLSGASLSGADLSGADLSGASLFGANLSGANLSGARFNSATRWPRGTRPEKLGAERQED
jgi:uncharacterized protein YjbI with pentapeptide repeats